MILALWSPEYLPILLSVLLCNPNRENRSCCCFFYISVGNHFGLKLLILFTVCVSPEALSFVSVDTSFPFVFVGGKLI